MRTVKKALGLALAACLGLGAGSASASNLDLDELGALLALPILTGTGESGAATAITVTNAGDAVQLHLNVISGDPGDYWRTQDFDCFLTAKETVLFVFTPDGFGGSLLSYECGGVVVNNAPLATANGIFAVALEDPGTRNTINTNQVFGDAVVIDYGAGAAFSVNAIPFQGVVPGAGVEDRKYRFDNVEYTEFPSALASNFIAPTSDVAAALVLFTLDGTTGSLNPPEAALSIKFYNDDEVQFSSSYHFDCFAIVDLLDIDGRFAASALGSAAGHLVLTPELVTYSNLAHDSQFDGGEGSVLGVRLPPVHGWIFQVVDGNVGSAPATADVAAWGRVLAQSNLPIVVSDGDTPVLNAP